MNLLPKTLSAQLTDTPLPFTSRLALDISKVIVGDFTDRAGFERQLPGTFGSQQRLWSEDDDLLFDKESRGLQYADGTRFAEIPRSPETRNPRSKARPGVHHGAAFGIRTRDLRITRP